MDGPDPNSVSPARFDREEFETWLTTQPVEVSLILAARSAMRVMPLLRVAVVSSKDGPDSVLLPLLRAMALPWSYVDSLNQRGVILGAASAAAEAAKIAATNRIGGRAAAAAVRAANTVRSARTVRAAIRNSVGAAEAAAKATSTAITAIAWDRKKLFYGNTSCELAREPLWHDEMPSVISDEWIKLTFLLCSRQESWEVWTEWYEDRLIGRQASPELEVARVVMPEGFWKQGAKAVNAELKRIRDGLPKEGDGATTEGADGGTDLPTDVNRAGDSTAPPNPIETRQAADAVWSYEQALTHGTAPTVTGTCLTLEAGGVPSDAQAARSPLVVALHPRLRQLAERLTETCRRRLPNYPEWQALREDAAALKELIDRDLDGIALMVAEVWALSVALAGVAETDQAAPHSGDVIRLPTEVRTDLQSLCAVLGPWLRNFPTANALDDAHRDWVAGQAQVASARSVARIADEHQLLLEKIANLLELALREGQGDGVQAQKSRSWGVGTVKRIALVALVAGGTVTHGYLQKLGADVQDESILAEKAKRTILDAEADLIKLMSDAPADIRQAVEQLLHAAKARD